MIKITVSKFIQVVYGYGQSSICGESRGSDHYACATEVTSPEAELTGSHGLYRVRMRGFPPRVFSLFFLTIVVVQSVGTRDPE